MPRRHAALQASKWLADVRKARGDYAGAREALAIALDVSERELGPRHLETIALVEGQAALAAAQGSHAEAADKFGRVVTALEEQHGGEGLCLARVLTSMAEAYRAAGNLEASELALVKSIDLQQGSQEAARLTDVLRVVLREQVSTWHLWRGKRGR